MNGADVLSFDGAEVSLDPFSHFTVPACMDARAAELLLGWFETAAPWRHRGEDDFYDCFDVNFRTITVPPGLDFLVGDPFLAGVRRAFESLLGAKLGAKMDVTAHKLVPGYRVGVHSDFGPIKQTYRFLVQLNRGFTVDNGGILMLFDEESPQETSNNHRYYLPRHQSAVGFEISERSFHAVSTVRTGERYTFCVSFYGDGS